MSVASDADEKETRGYPSAFWIALCGYPLLFGLLCRRRSDRAEGALKLVSTIHAVLSTSLAARDAFDAKWKSLNLITSRSARSNAVVAIEAGYLLQDTAISYLADSRYKIRFTRLMKLHHVVLGSLLTLFLEFARRKRERGVFFVEMFLLMNASTPLLNLRWFLRRRNHHGRVQALASTINDAGLVATFFACRIGLIYYMLWLYGVRTNRSVVQSFLSIPVQCKTGTASLLILNTLWWLSMARSTLKRHLK
ncbi:hypothetical protein FA10DRAFT_269838 [Acaromyces ingoldii]|uniref:TLC domain-containing protein n=1 Tax=Acaromyces ingoldii TaxID=215250 RepID=A0A316YEG0_9BASI|nr:hypothetical protein FA10DRAFT_269838 [Acaromyces ingoldii]PWN87264.1 hypothetical protein FA10DRAFT_269838 [Acaromyces ingoldii]